MGKILCWLGLHDWRMDKEISEWVNTYELTDGNVISRDDLINFLNKN